MGQEVEINGQWPSLEGERLSALLCYEMWHEGEVSEPAHTIFIQAHETWHRLYFDCGIIFWRLAESRPEEYGMPELGCDFKIVNIGEKYDLLNQELQSVGGKVLPGGAEVSFNFSGGKSICFANENDHTTYRT